MNKLAQLADVTRRRHDAAALLEALAEHRDRVRLAGNVLSPREAANYHLCLAMLVGMQWLTRAGAGAAADDPALVDPLIRGLLAFVDEEPSLESPTYLREIVRLLDDAAHRLQSV